MSLIRRIGSLLVFAILLGCGSDTVLRPPGGLNYSVAVSQCGPADGPAVAIFLTNDPAQKPNPSPPYVRIYIDLSNSALDGRQRSVAGSNAEAAAWFQLGIGPSVAADDGFVVATESRDTIDGSVDLLFPQAGHIVGAFHAPLFPNQALCP
jgi:hypothetical protein